MEELKTACLVDKLSELDREKKKLETTIKTYQAELQARGLRLLEDRNVKHTEIFGTEKNKADITYSNRLSIINYFRLKELCGEVIDDYVERSMEPKYSIKTRFSEVLVSIFNGDYEENMTIDTLLDSSFTLDAKQKSLITKKLKGDYKKDKQTLLAVLNGNDGDKDFDVELDFIHRIKNWERIKVFFNEENVRETIDAIRRNILVESTVKIGVQYESEDEAI